MGLYDTDPGCVDERAKDEKASRAYELRLDTIPEAYYLPSAIFNEK